MTTSTTEGTGYADPLLEISGLFIRELDTTETGANTQNGNSVLTGLVTGGTPGQASAFVQANLYAHGCLLTKTDGGASTPGVYENVGTLASPSWKAFATQ